MFAAALAVLVISGCCWLGGRLTDHPLVGEVLDSGMVTAWVIAAGLIAGLLIPRP